MEDGEQISSTTPHVDQLGYGEEWMADTSSEVSPFYHREAEPDDEILDLAGGGKEALERHKATVQQDLESPPADLFSKPTVAEQAAPVAEPKLDTGFGFSDAGAKRTSVAEEIADTSRKPQTPKVETVSPVKDSPTASPSSYEPIFPPSAPSQPLMHSSAEDRAQPLGKEGDSSQLGSVALAPSLSPLHTPDSLEELSLSESPNQAIMSAPFGSFAAPAIDFSQKSHWEVPLSEEVKAFECLSESKLGLGTDDHSFLGVRDKEGVKTSTFSPGEGDPFLSSLLTSEVDLGSKVETGKSGRCEDSGVASSPDEKLGSSGGSHDDGKTDSDKEGFDKDSESGESTGSTPTQSPVNTKVPTGSFLSYAPSDPTASLDAPHFESRDVIKDVDETAEDAFVSKTSWYETDLLSSKTGMDDFLCEVKSSSAAMNPFQGFSPIDDSGSGFPQFSETTSDRSDVKMSESPTPDLVQHAHDGELQDVAQIKCKEETAVDLVQMASDKPMDLPDTSVHSTLPEESKESSAPRSLPDILKSYPLSTGKVDSGSSEGSSDEHSPVQEVCVDNSPLDSSADPFAFNNKALLLKEMAEETEARETAVKDQQNVEVLAEKSFGAFDLVKEVETTTKTKDSPVLETEEKSWMFSGQHSTKSEKPEALNPPDSMNLPVCSPMKPSAVEESDSESPMTDSLSPVLEAMAKNPASFQIEVESKCMEELKTSPVKGIKGAYVEDHDVSEQEVSSEEFEFIERPPKGVMDEFLETLESAKFAKAPEMGTDDDASPGFGQGDLAAELESEAAAQQSSYLLLTQPASKASSQKLKADLENPPEPLEFEPQAQESASATDVFLLRSVKEEPEKPAPSQKKVEDLPTGVTVHPEAPKATVLPRLSAEAVVDLLYWRDVKATGVVFGAHLFLLLSLTVCSIISVCSYVALALLSVTITFRIYKGILQAVQKSDEGHPFKSYLAQEVTLSEDVVHKYSDLALVHLNNTIKELRRLFLVEDLVDSLKFAVLMWILTYVGALFNGLTLLILGLTAVFSVPIIYEKHQAQIDHYLALARNQIKDVLGKIQAKIPGMKPKAE